MGGKAGAGGSTGRANRDSNGGGGKPEEDGPRVSVERYGDEDALDRAARYGVHLSAAQLASVAGGSAGDKVKIEARNGNVLVTIKGAGLAAERRLYRDAQGRLVLNNSVFKVKATGGGVGTKFFTRQVQAAARAGVDRITTEAVRDRKYNGYYTWGRLGYNGPIPEKARARLPAQYRGAKDVRELMKTAGGREAWKKHGATTGMTFDLAKGSTSRKVLAAYNRERRTR